ncbi:inorganic diphosphatase [endosymbiont of Pachyrhynchus infernalis]|uniref:inorganic diphosphatase n=1 Tax=endosymbiont of Pachyrhynchus infernalis TaxID=1971488 RepID=UPI000DC6D9E6|nr:inorganic diphosphatase [endosymbiont of Pachyrhynchus infernalis]BBA84938.1 inorganic pyrophosphatase [endosymbiont of Pachyrhynchus infernalis]
MNINNIKPGNNIPDDINVIIEIPNKLNIKYEIDSYGNILIDRFINKMSYPCNYGFINKTLSNDNDNLDVVIPINLSLQIGSIINCRPIGILNMCDESGEDNKIIAVPNFNISNEFDNIKDIYDISETILHNIRYFFENYKNNYKNKWSKVKDFKDKKYAKEEIINSINKFIKKNNIKNIF